MLKKIFEAGVSENNTPEVNQKIKLTNQIALILSMMVALPFIAISLIYFYELTYIPVVGFFVCFAIIGLNIAGLSSLARVMMAILPVTLGSTYSAHLIRPEHPIMFEVFCLALSFVIIPFLVFDLKDKWWLLFCLAYTTILLVFLIEPLGEWLGADHDVSIIVDGYLGKVNIFLSIVFLTSTIAVLAAQSSSYQKQAQKLVDEMDVRNADLTKSENELKENIRQIEEKQKEEQKRNWVTDGIARFSNLMRSYDDSGDLYKQLVQELAKYVKANQCWLFLAHEEGDETLLKLEACYAYDRHKYLEKTIIPGEGLVGQAYLEQLHTYLKEIPDEYANIRSGLGAAAPRNVLIMPMVIDEKVEGVLEIASFHVMGDHEVDFVKQLGEAVASYISVNKINAKTKTLLEETQEQTEQMRAQEEEMRQNMEELAATQEEMQRKEQEYIDRIDSLEKQLLELDKTAEE
ncbi:MAG: GAF domain-containing protein [Bacteroidota bacterium]